MSLTEVLKKDNYMSDKIKAGDIVRLITDPSYTGKVERIIGSTFIVLENKGITGFSIEKWEKVETPAVYTHVVVDTMYNKDAEPDMYYVMYGTIEECRKFVSEQDETVCFYTILPNF